MSIEGVGYVAANGSSIKSYGEKRIVGHADSEEVLSTKIQRTEIIKVLGSAHRMNMGGNVVVLDGEKSYTQNKETGKKTSID